MVSLSRWYEKLKADEKQISSQPLQLTGYITHLGGGN